jgi:CheY-like chemotaxis protein
MKERPWILVVDDEPEVRQLVVEFLETRGYQTLTAASGEEAVSVVRQDQPDLILMDIMMPHMNGLEALQRIREIDREVGIIMLTAVDDELIAKQAMLREAYDYITKPLDFGYLELTILTKLAHARG